MLLVVCQDRPPATWAAGPFDMGLDDWPALTLRPLVLGPANVPLITGPEEAAQDVTLAVFSAMTHGRRTDPTAILEALATTLGALPDHETALYYAQLLEIGLGDIPARKTWRDMMDVINFFPGRGTFVEELYREAEADGRAKGMADGRAKGMADGRAKGMADGMAKGMADGMAAGKAEGMAKGMAAGVLRVLEQRRITVPDRVRARINSCADPDALSRMLDRSFTVDTADELFDDHDRQH